LWFTVSQAGSEVWDFPERPCPATVGELEVLVHTGRHDRVDDKLAKATHLLSVEHTRWRRSLNCSSMNKFQAKSTEFCSATLFATYAVAIFLS
jgi:hypothetical protein